MSSGTSQFESQQESTSRTLGKHSICILTCFLFVLFFLLNNRYMVTALMGADLNSILKCQKLTDEHVQFLVYQILRGLKVRTFHAQNVNPVDGLITVLIEKW